MTIFPGAGVEKHGRDEELARVGRRTPRWDSGTGTENVATLPATIGLEIWVLTRTRSQQGIPDYFRDGICSVL